MPGPLTPAKRAPESRVMALAAARAALEKHAESVVVMDLRGLSSVTDFFVICTADNARQMTALSEHIQGVLEQRGSPAWHTEGGTRRGATARGGVSDPRWMLIDCGDVVVHVFDDPARGFYRLEQLWADAPRVPVEPEPHGRT